MKKFLRGLDILFLARPAVLISVWGFSVFGYYCGSMPDNIFTFTILFGKKYLIAFGWMVLFSLAVGAVYVLNQIADYTVDGKNDGFPLLVKSGIHRSVAFWYAVVLTIIATGCPLIAGHVTLSILALSALILGTVYSFKPVYLSGRPFTDFLTNATGYSIIAFGAGWYLSPVENILRMDFFQAALPYFLLMCGGSISSTLPDIRGDSACGKRTTAVTFGVKGAHLITVAFVMAGGVAAFCIKDLPAFIIAIEFFIVDILYFILQSQKTMEATYKITGGIAMILAGVMFPVLIPAGSVLFGITWLYFRLRFGISYPSLVPVANASNKV